MTHSYVLQVVLLIAWWVAVPLIAGEVRFESFDQDPNWEGINNRSAQAQEPVTIRQDFGWSDTNHAGGERGEIGGYISVAAEPAYYAVAIPEATLEQKLTASGTIYVEPGAVHVLVGFFNTGTLNEWRTANTVNIRVTVENNNVNAYVEYCTSKWRAGGDQRPFLWRDASDLDHARPFVFDSKKAYPWTLVYDPQGNDGHGVITATIGDQVGICRLHPEHKADGAVFTHFGILNEMKSAYYGRSAFYLDNLTINGAAETFDQDPQWDALSNRTTYQSRVVRPRFDFGFSPTNFAGGEKPGEMGGQIFRGDCRFPEVMACYGDVLGPLTLDKPFKASGKIALTRGVTDSTVLFGFYNARDSMRRNDSQSSPLPHSVVGIHVEGPSREGFLFYPVWRAKEGQGRFGLSEPTPHIYPVDVSHDWVLEYDPNGAEGNGQITVTFDGQSATYDLDAQFKQSGTTFDRFGIVTTWIDGNSQDVYWDDITYTVTQE